MATLIGLFLGGRDPLIADVLRDRTALYRLVDSELENAYSLKLTNRSDEVMTLSIDARGLEGLRVVEPRAPVSVQPGQTLDLPLTLALPLTAADPGMQPMELVITDPDGERHTGVETRFYIPRNPDS